MDDIARLTFIPKENLPTTILIIGLIALTIVLISFAFFLRKKRKKKENDRRN